jgi:hypothetical protein
MTVPAIGIKVEFDWLLPTGGLWGKYPMSIRAHGPILVWAKAGTPGVAVRRTSISGFESDRNPMIICRFRSEFRDGQ